MPLPRATKRRPRAAEAAPNSAVALILGIGHKELPIHDLSIFGENVCWTHSIPGMDMTPYPELCYREQMRQVLDYQVILSAH